MLEPSIQEIRTLTHRISSRKLESWERFRYLSQALERSPDRSDSATLNDVNRKACPGSFCRKAPEGSPPVSEQPSVPKNNLKNSKAELLPTTVSAMHSGVALT